MEREKTLNLFFDLPAAGAERAGTAETAAVKDVPGQRSADALADDFRGNAGGLPLRNETRVRIGKRDTVSAAGEEKGLNLFKKRRAVRQEAHEEEDSRVTSRRGRQ